MITVQAPDLAALTKRLGSLSKMPSRDFGRVMSNVRARTETDAKRAIVAHYGLPQKRVAQDLRTGPVEGSPPSFTMRGKKDVIGLRNFGARVSKTAGISVVVKKTKGRTRIPGGFAAKGLGGNDHLWVRTGQKRVMTAGNYVGQYRDVIKPLFGPSVADMLTNEDVRSRIELFALSKMSAELERVINRILRANG